MNEYSSQDSILKYKGLVGYDTIGELITLLKEKMFERKVKHAVYKKVLVLMIELLENIFKYNDNLKAVGPLNDQFAPSLNIYQENRTYFLMCQNPVLLGDVVTLEERLKKLNSLSYEEVKSLYKKTITNGEFTSKGGAGLGLIEMAKITDEALDFDFKPIDDKLSYFTIQLKVHF